jgi:hypothetical protein
MEKTTNPTKPQSLSEEFWSTAGGRCIGSLEAGVDFLIADVHPSAIGGGRKLSMCGLWTASTSPLRCIRLDYTSPLKQDVGHALFREQRLFFRVVHINRNGRDVG